MSDSVPCGRGWSDISSMMRGGGIIAGGLGRAKMWQLCLRVRYFETYGSGTYCTQPKRLLAAGNKYILHFVLPQRA